MKKILTIFIVALGLFSCNDKKTKTTTTADNEKLVKQYFEHFNNHDFVAMARMYADTTDFKDPSLGQGIVKQTRQQTIEKYTALTKIFPDLRDQVTQIYPSGDKHIIVEFV